MEQAFSRTAMLLGEEGVARLGKARVAVFGLGGVGGYVVEALARAGIGGLDLIDKDTISPSNLNRQILATHSTLGMLKTQAARLRVADINPACQVKTYPVFYLPDTARQFDLKQYDYLVDAMDTVTAKLTLAQQAAEDGIPLISCMGTGNKLDAAAFQVADISKTTICPLARVMRKELKKTWNKPHEGGLFHGRCPDPHGGGGGSGGSWKTADPRLRLLCPRYCGAAFGRGSDQRFGRSPMTVVPAGTELVTKALPPMVAPAPMTVLPPRMEALA